MVIRATMAQRYMQCYTAVEHPSIRCAVIRRGAVYVIAASAIRIGKVWLYGPILKDTVDTQRMRFIRASATQQIPA
jgi:hypothetical protein